MSIAQFIDHAYRKACIAHGATPTVKRICISPQTFRDLAHEVRHLSHLTMYSDGQGPHYMGMAVHTAPIPDGLIILQTLDGKVIAAAQMENQP